MKALPTPRTREGTRKKSRKLKAEMGPGQVSAFCFPHFSFSGILGSGRAALGTTAPPPGNTRMLTLVLALCILNLILTLWCIRLCLRLGGAAVRLTAAVNGQRDTFEELLKLLRTETVQALIKQAAEAHRAPPLSLAFEAPRRGDDPDIPF